MNLVYILAPSHSGSTLLAMLLGAHSEICTVGEMKATHLGDPQGYRCSCGERIKTCGFWRAVAEGMSRRGLDFDITRAGTDIKSGSSWYTHRLLRPLVRGRVLEAARDAGLWFSRAWWTAWPEFCRRNVGLAETVCELTGARMIVDSSKQALRLKYLLKIPELRVKVVRLIRDGRGVALAYMNPSEYADAREPERRGGGTGASGVQSPVGISEAASQWRRNNQEAEHLRARVDQADWWEVRYEALCSDTQATMEGLFSFLGVRAEPTWREFRRQEHHVVGNGMRLDTNSEIRLDERWRTVLTARDLAVFEAVAGQLNRRYGYE